MTYLEAATQRTVVQRSLKVGAVVGSILVAINYGDRFFPYTLASSDWIKIVMTYCVPYCVSTYASVSTMMAHLKR